MTIPFKYLSVIALMLILSNCNKPEEILIEKPDNLIPERVMIPMLTEIQLVEAMIQKKIFKGSKKDDKAMIRYAAIFHKFKVSKEQFDESFGYYKKRPEDLEVIFEKVLIELTKRKAQSEGEKNTEPPMLMPLRNPMDRTKKPAMTEEKIKELKESAARQKALQESKN